MRPEPAPLPGVYGRFVNKFAFWRHQCAQSALACGNGPSANISLEWRAFLASGTAACAGGPRADDISLARASARRDGSPCGCCRDGGCHGVRGRRRGQARFKSGPGRYEGVDASRAGATAIKISRAILRPRNNATRHPGRCRPDRNCKRRTPSSPYSQTP